MSNEKVAAATKPQAQALAPPTQIDISDKHGHVPQNVERVKLSKGQQPSLPGEVTWKSTLNTETMVCFCKNGSPFANGWYFIVPPNGSKSSGPLDANATEQEYSYMVVGKDGFNDPVIIVDK